MENEHEVRVSLIFEEKGVNKTSKAGGYYSEDDLTRKHLKEIYALKGSDEVNYSPQGTVDMLRLIANILPKIKNRRHKLVIEKYLMGYSIREICKIVGYSAPSSVHEVIQKFKPLIRDEYEEEKAIIELFENQTYIYREPDGNIPKIEPEVAEARQILEGLFGFQTYIYPFDITPQAYKITLKHPDYGTYKLSQRGIIRFAEEIKKKLKENS